MHTPRNGLNIFTKPEKKLVSQCLQLTGKSIFPMGIDDLHIEQQGQVAITIRLLH